MNLVKTPYIILLLNIMAVFFSCRGQNNTQVQGKLSKQHDSKIAIGDTVHETSKNLMLVFQDTRNTYWFASDSAGLYCYDGKTLIHFTGKHGLLRNKIVDIQEDRSGNLYFSTGIGVSKFDGKTFVTLPVSYSNKWRLDPGDLWFKGEQDSGVVYRYDGSTLHRLKFPPTKAGEQHITNFPRAKFPMMVFNPYDVYTIYKDNKGNIWFGTGTLGVCGYDGKNFTWISQQELTGMDDPGGFGVRSISEDKNGKFWFSNSLFHFDVYNKKNEIAAYKKLKGPGSLDGKKNGELVFIISMAKDNNGNLWLATYNKGVWKYDGKNMIHYPVREGEKNINIFSIYKDRQDHLWLGTHQSGVYRFNGKTFERFIP